jgi:F0F1-type ATP synthase assembly protein I
MDPFKESVKKYLQTQNSLVITHLGPGDVRTRDEATTLFVESLSRQSKVNNSILFIIVGVYIVSLVLMVVLTYYHRDNPGTLKFILGSSAVSFPSITLGLVKLWEKKNVIDLLINLLPNLEPGEAIKVVQGIWFSKLLK